MKFAMKIQMLKISNAKFVNALTSLCILIFFLWSMPCIAQGKWDSSKVKGKSILYEISKSNESIFINNSKYEETSKSYTEYDPYNNEYSYVRLSSHEAILNAFKKVFAPERISCLSKSNDYIGISLSVDNKGKIIDVRFSLNQKSNILPCEIEDLENQLVAQVSFKIIGKQVLENIFYRVAIRVYFSEVEKGEIRMARNLEKLKAPNESSSTQ